jgi:hypothetical protein
MKSPILLRKTNFNRRCFSHCATPLAILLLAMPVAAQTPIAQNTQDTVGQSQVSAGAQQIAASTSTPSPTEISAPEAAQLKASPADQQTIPFLALAAGQDANQSSTQNAPSVAPAKAAAKKTKSSHHALAVTLTVMGTVALVGGAVLYAGERSAWVCSGPGNSSGCNTAKDSGLALMPIGAGIAATGLYLQFHF